MAHKAIGKWNRHIPRCPKATARGDRGDVYDRIQAKTILGAAGF